MSRPIVGLIHHRMALPWIFEAADRIGCDLLLLPRPGEVVDPTQLPSPVVDVFDADALADPAGTYAALARYQQERRLDGLLTMLDPAVRFTADAAARLGIPGLSPEVARRATDKHVLHTRLAELDGNIPAFTIMPMNGPYERVGLQFPVVIKPAGGNSSRGVVRVDDPGRLDEELARVAELCRRQLTAEAFDCGLLVEEYLGGAEYAVENIVWAGRTYVQSIGYKGQPAGPYFEEGVYRAPAPLDPALRSRIAEQVGLANQALGIDAGPVHTELRLRADGTPFVLDVGARVGGSGVSHFIVEHTVGTDLAGNALRVALGQPPVGLVDQPQAVAHAGNYIVAAGGAGIVDEVTGLAEVAAHPAVRHIAQLLFPGDEVRPYPEFSGYPAFILSVHDTAADLIDFHEYLDKAITVRYRRYGHGQ